MVFDHKLKYQWQAAFLKVNRKAWQRVASVALCKSIKDLKFSKWSIGSTVPSYGSNSGMLNWGGKCLLMIFWVNGGSVLKLGSASGHYGAFSASIHYYISRSLFFRSFRVGGWWGEKWSDVESLLKIGVDDHLHLCWVRLSGWLKMVGSYTWATWRLVCWSSSSQLWILWDGMRLGILLHPPHCSERACTCWMRLLY